MRISSLLITLVLLAATLQAQVYSIYPGNPQGASTNNYPFGAAAPAGMRLVNHIPVTALDPANPYITDLSFYSPYTGTWSAATVKIGVGHLPTAIPCPFSFPAGAGGSSIGSFNDLTVMWDSSTDGPLSFNVSPNQWNPLSLPSSGRVPFQWNGIDPVGIFIRLTSATTTGDTRMSTSPQVMRTYAFNGNPGQCNATGGLFVRMHLGCGGAGWQVNHAAASLDMNGLTNDPCGPIVLDSCVDLPTTLNASSTQVGLPHEIATTTSPGVPVGAGGTLLPGGQIINLDLTDPSINYWYGFTWTVPFVPFSVPFSYPVPVSVSAQMATTDPVQPLGVALSALNEYSATTSTSQTFQLGLDGFTEVNVGQPPFCGAPISFYGTTYTSFFVNANGFVSFTGGDSWWAADPSYWTTLMPRIGVWTDFNSQSSGTISAGVNGSRITVSYQNVPVTLGLGSGAGPASSFDIEFDTLTGGCAILNLLANPLHSQATLIGITPGNGAGDPGATAFSTLVGAGPQVGPGGNNILYDFDGTAMPQGYSGVAFPNGDASLFTVF